MHVVFLNPADGSDPFFGLATRAMEAAAGDLGVELEVLEGQRRRGRFRDLALGLADRARRPDYLLLVNDLETSPEVLPRVTAAGISVLMLFDGFSTADRLQHGEPGERYPRWIGELLPDDLAAGRELAERLIAAARRRGLHGADGKLQLAALSGPFTHASVLRINGLRACLREHPDTELTEIAPAGWDRQRAADVIATLLDRHPGLAMVWAANDAMGLGALDAAAESRRTAGRDLLVGGIDWAAEAIARIRDGSYEVTLGGHFLDGAWALVLLRAHHGGTPLPCRQCRSRMVAITADTVDRFAPLLDADLLARIDFAHAPALGAAGTVSAETALAALA